MMRSTGDALARGFGAGEVERKRWRGLRAEFGRQFDAALDRKQYDLAGMMAVQAQLCREALEAGEARQGSAGR